MNKSRIRVEELMADVSLEECALAAVYVCGLAVIGIAGWILAIGIAHLVQFIWWVCA